jgi:sugar/nucleoside kinase (ribokinase family)
MEEVLGGSASYFSYAARLFAPVQLVGVVGDDFPQEHVEEFRRRGIDVDGLIRERGRTFRWWGRYRGAMNVAETLDVQLNVFGEFRPEVPDEYRDAEFVFLANAAPEVQVQVRRQVPAARLVVADTMNFWIENEREGLLALLAEVDGVVVNDQEARQLTGVQNLILAAREVLALGPSLVVVKKGEHGAMLVTETDLFMVPAYPTTAVKDPTGAGDSFAGGMMGHLARCREVTDAHLREALGYGTVVASLTVEDFSLRRLAACSTQEVEDRLTELRQMTQL